MIWNRIKELSMRGLNKSQIERETGVSRKTIRHYLSQTAQEFVNSTSYNRTYRKKLKDYEIFVKNELERCSDLSAAQIRDHLIEHYPELKDAVCDKTFYNFVMMVRRKYSIEKSCKPPRDYNALPPSPYGESIQVDFGEYHMQTSSGHTQTVHFMTMILSRSRYKYVIFQTAPFTSETAVRAHHEAFKFFGGMTKVLIYDQDKVFLRNENLGDYVLTTAFGAYVKSAGIKTVFCRKADPESKGKIERVVRYVKYNFLRGRMFRDIDTLNDEAIAWLKRTGNGHVHATTRQVPSVEYEIEKMYLLPYNDNLCMPESKAKIYVIRKDNTIAYRGNFYTLPVGSYNKYKYVELTEQDGILVLRTRDGKELTKHTVCTDKGQLIQKPDHKRDMSSSISELESSVLAKLGFSPIGDIYIQALRNHVGERYYRDNLKVLSKLDCDSSVLSETLEICASNLIYNANEFRNVAHTLTKKRQSQMSMPPVSIPTINSVQPVDIEVDKSSMLTYERIIG